jgi:ABC-2 type transport system permease protein
MIINVARKELKSMFASPMGWVILALMQGALGTYFTLSFNQYFEILSLRGSLPEQMGMTQFMCEGIFDTASILFIFMTPLVSMRLMSDEYRSQTMTFLTSAPISIKEIILGKYIALISYHTLLITTMLLMIISLGTWIELDYGLMLTNALGLWLLMCGIAAMGLFFSAQTQYAVIAGFLTFLSASVFVLAEKFYSENMQSFLANFSILSHYRNFAHGLMNSFDIVFFMLFSTFFILMTMHRLHMHRISE